MENLFNLLKTIKEDEFAYITSFAEMDKDNKNFKDYEYFLIEKENMFFYIQKTSITDWANNINGKYSVTAYKKIDYNTKQQLSYPVGFENYEELKNIIAEMLEELSNKNTLSKTYKQIINHELKTFYNTQYGKITLFDYLKKIAGYRELEVLKNIDHMTMNINNKDYLVLEFYNKENQSFAINTKNINRLIIS